MSLYFHRQTFEGIGDKEYGIPGTDWDNLATYIYSETSKDVQQRRKSSPNRWPEVKLSEDIKFISADPSEMKAQNFSIHCELIQLTDILTGAVTQAIAAISTRKTKRELASIVGEWMSDIRIEPWKQRLGLHRKFGVSYFPDANGRLYNDGQLKIAKRLPGSRQGKLLK
ncbi:MAG: hypothetical protein JXB38_17565 [Anaerolineales bacterium]|nr:hypothetical protein [Anaerolineales bacterium]